MSRRPAVVYFILPVLVVLVLSAGCSTFPGGSPAPSSTREPVSSATAIPALTPALAGIPVPAACGFTTCHGPDLACGTDVPDACTMEYQAGDRCRQFASCDTGGGSCTLVISPRYVSCRECAERCRIQAGPDGLAAVSCEESC